MCGGRRVAGTGAYCEVRCWVVSAPFLGACLECFASAGGGLGGVLAWVGGEPHDGTMRTLTERNS